MSSRTYIFIFSSSYTQMQSSAVSFAIEESRFLSTHNLFAQVSLSMGKLACVCASVCKRASECGIWINMPRNSLLHLQSYYYIFVEWDTGYWWFLSNKMVAHYEMDQIGGPVCAHYFQQSSFTRVILLDSLPPAGEWRDVINYCSSRRAQLIIACSSSAHIIWWSTRASLRGES
jgi:hypothetical protein